MNKSFMENNLNIISEACCKTFLTFKIKEEFFAVNTETVSDIIEIPSIIKLPGSPESIRGVISFSKIAVPVVDLRVVMHFHKVGINVNSSLILFKINFNNQINLLGALVDSIEEFIELDMDQVIKINSKLIDLVSEVKNLKYKILNPQKLISPEDYLTINNLISKASLTIK